MKLAQTLVLERHDDCKNGYDDAARGERVGRTEA
jgi:hypothetical protein